MTLRDLIEKKAFAGRGSIDSDDLYLVQQRIFVRKRLRCESKFGLALSSEAGEVFDTVSFLTPTTLVPAGQLDSEPAYRCVSLLVDVVTLAFRPAIQNVIPSSDFHPTGKGIRSHARHGCDLHHHWYWRRLRQLSATSEFKFISRRRLVRTTAKQTRRPNAK